MKKNYFYAICMIFFAAVAYLFFDRGFNVKTKNVVNYREKSDIVYRVYLQENDDYQQEYLNMNERYMRKLVDHISFDFEFNDLYSRNINGYYMYYVKPTLHAYLDETMEDIWNKEYDIFDKKVVVLNENNLLKMEVSDRAILDYKNCVDDLLAFSKKYGIDLLGYVEMEFVLEKHLKFEGIDKVVDDNSVIKVNVPLSSDTFKIDINNDDDIKASYYDFSTKEKVNYLLLVIASFFLAFAISFLALVIRNIIFLSCDRNKYVRELNKILSMHNDKIIKIKRFYNKKKYNLIYVSSFLELLDVYDKVGNPISYREIKKGAEAIFLLIEGDNAWIYRMKA